MADQLDILGGPAVPLAEILEPAPKRRRRRRVSYRGVRLTQNELDALRAAVVLAEVNWEDEGGHGVRLAALRRGWRKIVTDTDARTRRHA